MDFEIGALPDSNFAANGTLEIKATIARVGGSFQERKQGKDEFETFVKKTYRALAVTEGNVFGGTTSIRVFCRMDIGLMVDPQTHKLSYFVNEVERTLTTSLWSQADLVDIDSLGDTFSDVFGGWLGFIKSPEV